MQPEFIFIKPAKEGAIVRHPEKLNYVIPAQGELVKNSPQWQRYLRVGDVVLAEQPPAQQEKSTKGGNK